MPQRFEGKNLEEALGNAAAALGVERYQITHSVILEKRGFLGGVKRVVIEADVNREAERPVEPPRSAPPPPPAERERRPARGRGMRGEGRRERGDARRGREGGGRGRHREHDLRPGDFERAFAEAPPQGDESEQARSVREWCEQALSLARLDLDVRTSENEEQIVVRLYGRDARRMTEGHGELLDAIQVLANKALVGRRTEKDIELDCDEFKERRVEEIEQRAKAVADRVRRDGREQLLPAMSPIERRIVHLALQNDEGVATESRGDGFYKRVAIVPRAASEAPEAEVPGEP